VIRPAGLAPGAAAIWIGWAGMVVVAMLMGAAAVILVAVPAGIGLLWSLVSGALVLRRATVADATIADGVIGSTTLVTVSLSAPQPVLVSVATVDGHALTSNGNARWAGQAVRRGVFQSALVSMSSAGRTGLMWWERTERVTTSPWCVSAAPILPGSPITTVDNDDSCGALGQIDGTRPFADGDTPSRVHWPSSERSGALVARETVTTTSEVAIRVHRSSKDSDHEAGAVVATAERALAAGNRVVLLSGADAIPIDSLPALRRWSAAFEQSPEEEPAPTTVRRRQRITLPPDTFADGVPRSLVATAAVRATAVAFLLTALQVGWIGTLVAMCGSLAIAQPRVAELSRTRRLLAGSAVATVVMATTVQTDLLTEPHQLWRAALPQMLAALLVLHGFDSTDRRALRVGIAFAAVVATYAAAIRLDAQLPWWLLAMVVTTIVALRALRAGPPGRQRGGWRPSLAIAALSAPVLALVPLPSGPTRLLSPAFVSDGARPTVPGQLVEADPGSAVGGYPGFAESFDTSWRGTLGDDIVLRVRSPYPDFWRGQTFGEFDGRTWSATGTESLRIPGPYATLAAAFGDHPEPLGDTYVQTVVAEVDLGNVIYGAPQMISLVVDGNVTQREDGAVRLDRTLPAGSSYSVTSVRSAATPALLRGDGVVRVVDGSVAAEVFGSYVDVPPSTSERTRQLAAELAGGRSSTYDVVRAMEQWLSDNVTYNLAAPTPADGQDAVDHFLFESQQGFCEQIASALTVMLRSLGVPARVATGYVPSERDPVSGAWISRARDAHAWVEVFFPSVGWQAFDPTANVPLSGDAPRQSVGGAALDDVGSWLRETLASPPPIVLLLAAVGVLFAGRPMCRRITRLLRRGRWGRLQDRLDRAAQRAGVPAGAPNGQVAAALGENYRPVAETLDRVAFDPCFGDDDDTYWRTRRQLSTASRR
jgi:transglutaminase-like putative cysteine protease